MFLKQIYCKPHAPAPSLTHLLAAPLPYPLLLAVLKCVLGWSWAALRQPRGVPPAAARGSGPAPHLPRGSAADGTTWAALWAAGPGRSLCTQGTAGRVQGLRTGCLWCEECCQQVVC